jgi:ABC-type amino acid transport system permease subunit
MIGSGQLAAYLLLLLRGTVVTLQLSLGALAIGSLAGFLLAAMRSSRFRPLRLTFLVRVEALRHRASR